MADQQIANLEVQFGVDVTQLKAGIRAAQREFKGMMGAVGGLDKSLSRSAEMLRVGGNEHQALAKMGIRTTASINAEIKALEQLEKSLMGDSHAMAQVISRKEALQASLIKTEQVTNRAASANHRANLFMINFSRGIEDLKFGLPAVINNLEGIALGYQMMAKEADAAGESVASVLRRSLTSPAGMLAILNLIVTAAFLLGPTLKRSFDKGRVGARQLKSAVSDIVEVDTSQFDSLFRIDSIEDVERAMGGVEKELVKVRAQGKAAVAGLNPQLFLTVTALEKLGMGGEWAAGMLAKMFGDEQTTSVFAYRDALEDMEAKFKAMLVAAKAGSAAGLSLVAPEGSLNEMERDLRRLDKELASTSYLYDKINTQKVQDIFLNKRMIENTRGYIEAMSNARNTLSRYSAEASFLRDENDRMTRGFMSMENAAQIANLEMRAGLIETFNDAAIEVKKFRTEAAFMLGDAAVGGAFEGLFRGLSGPSADEARLALIGLRKEFGSLEESLAKGDISYEEFAIKNRMRLEEMRKAQADLAFATRSTFEQMADRLESVFDGMKKAVIGSFREIAQEYTRLLIRRGISRLIGNLVLPGIGGGTVSAVVSGISGAPSAAGNIAQRVAIAPQAQVIPSGDLQISLRRAGSISSRTGV